MNDANSLYRLVYVSRPVRREGMALDAEVAQILRTSQRNNGHAGVTGALLFNGECFAQALEGPMEDVTATYERIQCDPRHRDTVILQAGPVDAREFGEWSMAYAGRVDSDRLRFERLGVAGAAEERTEGATAILDAMRGVALRAQVA